MNWDEPHCPSWTGGVAATSIKVAKHRQGADGVVVQMFCSSLNNHPVCADSGCFAIFSFWHNHPSCPGGAMGLIPIRSHLHRPRLQSRLLVVTADVCSLADHMSFHGRQNLSPGRRVGQVELRIQGVKFEDVV